MKVLNFKYPQNSGVLGPEGSVCDVEADMSESIKKNKSEINASPCFFHKKSIKHTEKSESMFCYYLTIRLASHLSLLAYVVIRITRDKIGKYTVYHKGTSFYKTETVQYDPQHVISQKMHPTHAVRL